MNRIFNTNYNHKTLDIALLIFRVGVSALMLSHGVTKLNNLLAGGDIQFADPFGLGMTASLALAVFAEFLCSVLLILGLGTRLVVIPLIVTMLVALLTVHIADPFNKQELPLFYLLSYFTLFLTGAGALSVDNILSRKAANSRRGY